MIVLLSSLLECLMRLLGLCILVIGSHTPWKLRPVY